MYIPIKDQPKSFYRLMRGKYIGFPFSLRLMERSNICPLPSLMVTILLTVFSLSIVTLALNLISRIALAPICPFHCTDLVEFWYWTWALPREAVRLSLLNSSSGGIWATIVTVLLAVELLLM